MTRIGLALTLALSACYSPAGTSSCALTCDPMLESSDCPGSLMCNAQGRCSTAGGACLPDSGVDPDGPGPDPDGTPPIDDPPGLQCFGTPPIRPCFAVEPTGSQMVSMGFNTDTACPLVMDLDGRSTCVIAARDVTFGTLANVRFSGTRPLVVVGVFSITVNTTLDLSSSRFNTPRIGAGAQPVQCQTAGDGMNNQDGGAGGSFGGKGGDGGRGTGGASGGLATGLVSSIRFRGGCEGGKSGNNDLSGPGGGAVYLISNLVTVSGAIRATGGGGAGGADSSGGGGGGSGGYIGIDAANVNVSGILSATGGGGGGGGCMGTPGNPGIDADASGLINAPGGPGADIDGKGDGGAGGSVKAGTAGQGVDSDGTSCAGGGGGGGAGTIQFFRGKSCGVNNCHPDDTSNP